MSSSANEEPEQELDHMRELIRQYQQRESQTAQLNQDLQKKIDDLELEKISRSPLTPFSPIPAQNLQSAMMSVAILDETKVQNSILASNTALESKLTQLFESKFSAFIHQQNTSRPISAATPLGAKVYHGLPGLIQSPLISNVLGGAPGNSSVVPNDYDKAVEVEQRKLCDPILTPPAIRAWKLVFDVYIV